MAKRRFEADLEVNGVASFLSTTVTGDLVVTGETNTHTLKVGTSALVSNLNAEYLNGYGPGDFQPVDPDLTAIAALAGTSGYLKKTSLNTWALDPSAGGDFYEGWNILVNTTPMGYMPSKNTATTYAGGLNLVQGYGMYLSPASATGNRLQITLDVAMTNNISTLAADVQLVNANQFYTVRTLTLPSNGTYLIFADLVVKNTSGAASIVTAKIHTSTTNYASSTVNRSMYFDPMSMHCLISGTAGQVITLSAAANTANVNYIDTAADTNAAGNTLTRLTYIRIA